MIDSIFVAMSGLAGHQRALRTISNNIANMNSAGFKGSSVGFVDMLGGGGAFGRGLAGRGSSGGGLDASRLVLDMRAGESKQTGRDLDLSLQGSGFFVVRDDDGALRYTRNGSFEFDADGALIMRDTNLKVMARDAAGRLAALDLAGLRVNAPKPTAEVDLTGNLSSTDTDHTIDDLEVYDALGGAHKLRVEFRNNSSTTPGRWTLTVFEGTTQVGTGEITFANGRAAEGASPLRLSLTLADSEAAQEIAFAFGEEVTSFSSGSTSTLVLKKQDGYTAGLITAMKFDDKGTLQLTYSNGQTATGAKLALAEVSDDRGLESLGEGLFAYAGKEPAVIREAGDDLKVAGQTLELSNVDLTQEFSALILMQRGYQASSQVISTANDMLQQLFDMKGRR